MATAYTPQPAICARRPLEAHEFDQLSFAHRASARGHQQQQDILSVSLTDKAKTSGRYGGGGLGRDRRGRCPGGKASYRDGPPRVPRQKCVTSVYIAFACVITRHELVALDKYDKYINIWAWRPISVHISPVRL